MAVTSPSIYASINPPPPRLPALGRVMAKEKPTPTAASIALPPAFKIARPSSEDSLF